MTGQPYCGAAPNSAELLTRWNFDPVLLLCLAAGLMLHFSILRRDNARIGDRRVFCFVSVWILGVALFVSPLCALTSALFSVRVAHHMIMVAVIAPLFVLSLPERIFLLRPIPGSAGVIAAIHGVVLWYWHAPTPYAAALSSYAVFWLMELSLLGSALVFWFALFSPRTSTGEALLTLLTTVIQMGLLGALITFARVPLYVPHFATTEMWGLSALADQQLAGLLMWVPAAIPYVAAALWRLSRVLDPAPASRVS